MLSKNQAQAATIEKENSEEVLKRYDRYIIMHTRLFALQYPISAPTGVVDLEIDELIQLIRIKFWRALEKSEIHSPQRYIQRIIRNEFIDFHRRNKRLVPLPVDEEEHWSQREMETLESSDPADEVQQKADETARLQEAIPIILSLPPRQQLAMICSLRDLIDDPVQLSQAFRNYKKNIDGLRWPTGKAEKQLMGASLSVARSKLRQKMQKASRVS